MKNGSSTGITSLTSHLLYVIEIAISAMLENATQMRRLVPTQFLHQQKFVGTCLRSRIFQPLVFIMLRVGHLLYGRLLNTCRKAVKSKDVVLCFVVTDTFVNMEILSLLSPKVCIAYVARKKDQG